MRILVLLAIFISSQINASVYVAKGSAEISGYLYTDKGKSWITINPLSRSRFQFRVKNPKQIASFNPDTVYFVDAKIKISKVISSHEAEAQVNEIKVSQKELAPQYSQVP